MPNYGYQAVKFRLRNLVDLILLLAELATNFQDVLAHDWIGTWACQTLAMSTSYAHLNITNHSLDQNGLLPHGVAAAD